MVASIALWEAVKWILEWISLRRSGTVSEARGARRLRRLQQTISEEVARYDLDAPEEVLGERTPRSSSTTRSSSTPRPASMRRTTPTRSPPMRSRSSWEPTPTVGVVSVGIQTEPMQDGYHEFRGPFVMSEHGDRVHYHPACHGLRNAMTRRRQVTLCQYCERQQGLYQFTG